MKAKQFFVTVALCVPLLASAAEPFTCTELGLFAHSVAVARDKGHPLQRSLDVLDQDNSFTPSDRKLFKDVIRKIYGARSISAEDAALMAANECNRTGKRKR